MGAIPSRSPEAKPTGEGGIAPISKDEDGIGQCVRARLTVLTLLLCKLEATSKPGKMDKVLRNTFCCFFKVLYNNELEIAKSIGVSVMF